MSDQIKACVDRYLPEERILAAAQLAIRENSHNEPTRRPGLDEMELAVVTGKKWRNGKILKVAFLDGHPDVHARVEPLAHVWSGHANISFEFGNHGDAHVRISFALPGSWSYLGTDAMSIENDAATMNYGWLRPDSSDAEFERVVLHEFGHALGCIHEHQNPASGIPWDEEKVYAYYMGPPNNWTKARVYNNLLQKYSSEHTQFSEFDRESIMLYPVPNEHTVGDYEVGWNRKLSLLDKKMIAEMYPKDG